MIFVVIYLYNGNESKVFDLPMSHKKCPEIGDIIAINEVYYKVFDIQHRFEVRGGNNLMPIEIKISARNKEEELKYRSVEQDIENDEFTISFAKELPKYLNQGHSTESALQKHKNIYK